MPVLGQNEPTKRKRASKPKVRTGCLTCKIRRVKCGEERPSCLRCTSTGRACDGYNKPVPSIAREADVARNELLIVQRHSIQPRPKRHDYRILPSPTTDIEGTHDERLYFHCLRRVTEAGSANHVTNLTTFWSRLAPQISHFDDAVKHAMVALGSAYHTHHESLTIGEEGRQPRQLDIFTMQQYSMAMSKLSTNSNFPSKDRLTVTLLCCVTFVCIETLRNNWRPALAHLSNGLRIIETLPMSTLDKLRDTHAAQDWSKSTDDQIAMDYILRLFATWEVSSALFTEDFKPVICLKLYEGRELDDTALPEFESVLHAHRHGVQYARDVFALVWQTRKHQGDEEFWSQSRPQRQHEVLMNRGSEISDLFANFMKSPRGPAPETDAYYSACLDIMHCKCTRLLCENLRLKTHQRSQSPEVLARYAELVTLCIPIHQRLVARRGQAPKMPRAFTLDIGIVPSVHFIAATCQDPIVQRSALHILRDYPQREGFWDGNSVRNLIVTADSVSSDPTHPLKAVPKSLALARGIPALYEKLEELRVSVKNDVRTP